MSTSVTSLGYIQSDVTTPSGDSTSSSFGTAGAVSAVHTGDTSADGLGIGQSNAHSADGNAAASSAGFGTGAAFTGHGDASAIGLGIGQSEAHAPNGSADATSLGIGSAIAGANHGASDATGMGIAQAAEHSGDRSADDQAFGIGHGEASGKGSVSVGAGVGLVEDTGHSLASIPGEFGSIDLSGLHGHGNPGGDAHGFGGRVDGLIAKFEAAVQHLMQEAHDYLTGTAGAADGAHGFSIGGHGAQGQGEVTFNDGTLTDPTSNDQLRSASFGLSEQVTLDNGKTISLSFAYAEQDDTSTGKAQIATGFGFSEGTHASSFATADAGYQHADAGLGMDSGSSMHPAGSMSFA